MTTDGPTRQREPDPMAWANRGNCLGVDADLFFPERGASSAEAKEVCRGCVVKAECLEYAIVNQEKFGIWGGLSERQRRRLRRGKPLTEPTKIVYRSTFTVVEDQ